MKQKKRNCFLLKIFSLLLVILGFSACSNEKDDGEMLFMYGTPTAKFTIKGKVIHATEKDQPLSDIQIVIYPMPEENARYHADTLFTDNNGLFELNSHCTGIPKVHRIVYEVPEKNKETLSLKKGKLDVAMKQTEKGDGAWYKGKYEAEVLIKMEDDRPTYAE